MANAKRTSKVDSSNPSFQPRKRCTMDHLIEVINEDSKDDKLSGIIVNMITQQQEQFQALMKTNKKLVANEIPDQAYTGSQDFSRIQPKRLA